MEEGGVTKSVLEGDEEGNTSDRCNGMDVSPLVNCQLSVAVSASNE
jgi:hypothetical protein